MKAPFLNNKNYMNNHITNPSLNQEDQEWISENVESKVQPPEAPGSIHIDSYINGFHVGWTKRLTENQLDKQVPAVKAFVTSLMEYGFKPSWNEDTNGKALGEKKPLPTLAGLKCETCGSPAEQRSGIRKNNTTWTGIFCSSVKEHVKWTS